MCTDILISLKVFVLSKSETSRLFDRLASSWPPDILPKVKNIKVYEIERDKWLLAADKMMVAVQVRGLLVPFLGEQEELQRFPSVTIDRGAVKFVCNGAKVMRPGIINFDSFKKGEIVVVKDQTHGRGLAVGLALEDSEVAKAMTKGYIIDTIHYISDKIWEAYKKI
ncbi:MAG TPA: PUA domain-containing protein [Nitrososphaera sp.]|nr:PUA domain-containing protein [Nitrososphaera sp.]